MIGKLLHIQNKIIIAGNPQTVENIKNLFQPKASTIKPDGDDKIVLAKPIIDESSAY